MAVKHYMDDIVPADGRTYQIVDIQGGDTCHILDVTQYSQRGTEFHAADVNAGCLLETEYSKAGTVHKLVTPNEDTENIKFRATADYNKGDTFTLNGTAVDALTVSGRKLESGHFKSGAMVSCLLSRGTLYFEGSRAPVIVDDTTGAIFTLGIDNGKLYIKEDE